MQKLQIQMQDVRFDRAKQRFEANVTVRGRTTMTVPCVYCVPVDTDLKKVVHHMNPNAPWYQLPQLYEDGKDRYLACNEAYVYRSYAQIFRQYLLRAKDPVPHPLWPKS